MLSRLCQAFAALALAITATSSAFADDRNPIGERANYVLDHSSSRTSSMILDGTMTSVVNGASGDGTGYVVQLDYRMKLRLLGTKSGSKSMAVDTAFFTPEFLVQLRNQGSYVGAHFKVQWLGYEDATTSDGRFYQACDKVRIYDIDTAAPFSFGDDIDDMQIKADIYYGVPVLGAVKLDVSGKYAGQNVKMGVDYRAP
jgi:hypothetical protein